MHFKPAGGGAQPPSLTDADFPLEAPPAQLGPAVQQPAGSWTARLTGKPAGRQHRARIQPPSAASAVQQLLRQQTWAGVELAEAVLEAAGQDAEVASAMLAEMGASCGTAPHGCAQPAAAERGGAPPHGDGAMDRGLGGSEEEEDEHASDPYFRFRARALQLGRRWHRAARAAAAAHTSGQHSVARQLAAEARKLRQEALAAHAEAAEQIETENNRSNGWAHAFPNVTVMT